MDCRNEGGGFIMGERQTTMSATIKSLINKIPLFKMDDKDKRKEIVQFSILLWIYLMITGILNYLGNH